MGIMAPTHTIEIPIPLILTMDILCTRIQTFSQIRLETLMDETLFIFQMVGSKIQEILANGDFE